MWCRRQHSPTLAAVRALPTELKLYSNGSDAIRFLTGGVALALPRKAEPESLRANPGYGAQLEAIRTVVAQGAAAVASFDLITWRCYLPSRADLDKRGFPPPQAFDDGALYGTRSMIEKSP